MNAPLFPALAVPPGVPRPNFFFPLPPAKIARSTGRRWETKIDLDVEALAQVRQLRRVLLHYQNLFPAFRVCDLSLSSGATIGTGPAPTRRQLVDRPPANKARVRDQPIEVLPSEMNAISDGGSPAP